MTEGGTMKHLLMGSAVVCLFAFLLITFAIRSGSTYGKDVSDLESDALNLTGINDTLQSAHATAESWRTSFQATNPISLVVGVLGTGIWSLSKTMYNFIILPFSLFSQMMIDVLKVPSIVVDILIFGLIISMIFGVWRLLKIGD